MYQINTGINVDKGTAKQPLIPCKGKYNWYMAPLGGNLAISINSLNNVYTL